MEPTYFAQYRGFEFHCSPERLGERAFAPRLVIQDGQGSPLEIALDPSDGPATDPTVAAHRAFALGRRWVDGTFQTSGPTAPAPLLDQ